MVRESAFAATFASTQPGAPAAKVFVNAAPQQTAAAATPNTAAVSTPAPQQHMLRVDHTARMHDPYTPRSALAPAASSTAAHHDATPPRRHVGQTSRLPPQPHHTHGHSHTQHSHPRTGSRPRSEASIPAEAVTVILAAVAARSTHAPPRSVSPRAAQAPDTLSTAAATPPRDTEHTQTQLRAEAAMDGPAQSTAPSSASAVDGIDATPVRSASRTIDTLSRTNSTPRTRSSRPASIVTDVASTKNTISINITGNNNNNNANSTPRRASSNGRIILSASHHGAYGRQSSRSPARASTPHTPRTPRTPRTPQTPRGGGAATTSLAGPASSRPHSAYATTHEMPTTALLTMSIVASTNDSLRGSGALLLSPAVGSFSHGTALLSPAIQDQNAKSPFDTLAANHLFVSGSSSQATSTGSTITINTTPTPTSALAATTPTGIATTVTPSDSSDFSQPATTPLISGEVHVKHSNRDSRLFDRVRHLRGLGVAAGSGLSSTGANTPSGMGLGSSMLKSPSAISPGGVHGGVSMMERSQSEPTRVQSFQTQSSSERRADKALEQTIHQRTLQQQQQDKDETVMDTDDVSRPGLRARRGTGAGISVVTQLQDASETVSLAGTGRQSIACEDMDPVVSPIFALQSAEEAIDYVLRSIGA